MSVARQRWLAVLVTIGCFGTAVALQIARDRFYPRQSAEVRAMLYVRSGAAMRRMALSFDALVADIYWIRALQHYGGDRLDHGREPKYELLYPLLDLTTSLDPMFSIAYRFGSIFLGEAYPGGAGRPDLAIALLEKGIAAQPDKWHYYYDIGFVHYWHLRDMEAAARWFRRAADIPGAPTWLESLAATVLVEGGDRASARFLLQQILQSDEPWMQRMATRGLGQLDALDAMDALRRIAAAHPPREGQPYSWNWLVQRGALSGIPADPTGVPFEIDPATGEISVSRRSDLYPMPRPRTLQ